MMFCNHWFKVASISMLALSPAIAGPADNYVKGLEGKWRGGGVLTVNDRGKKLKLRCSTKNTLNRKTRTLVLAGKCATSSGTRSLRGTMKYSADGTKLTTVRLSLGGRSSGSYSSLKGNTLVLSGTFRDEAKNKDVRGRTFVKAAARSLHIRFQSNGAGSWENHGTLKFKR